MGTSLTIGADPPPPTVGAGGQALLRRATRAGEQAAWRSVEAAAGVNLSLVGRATADRPGSGRPGRGRRRVARPRPLWSLPKPLVTSLIRSRVARAGRSPRDRDAGPRGDRAAASAVPGFGGEGRRGSLDRRPASAVPGCSRSASARRRGVTRPGRAPCCPRARRSPAGGPRAPLPGDGRRAARRPRGRYLEGLPPDAFQVRGAPRRLRADPRSGAVDLDAWPDELGEARPRPAARAGRARSATEDELREAAYRVELPMLERRAAADARRRATSAGRLEALDLARRVRAALRGER